MHDELAMTQALMRVSQDFATAEDPTTVINNRLAHHGFDPEAVAKVAGIVLAFSVQSGETPEDSVRGSFTMGVLLGAMMGTNRDA